MIFCNFKQVNYEPQINVSTRGRQKIQLEIQQRNVKKKCSKSKVNRNVTAALNGYRFELTIELSTTDNDRIVASWQPPSRVVNS